MRNAWEMVSGQEAYRVLHRLYIALNMNVSYIHRSDYIVFMYKHALENGCTTQPNLIAYFNALSSKLNRIVNSI